MLYRFVYVKTCNNDMYHLEGKGALRGTKKGLKQAYDGGSQM